jgi:hypothetical protein
MKKQPKHLKSSDKKHTQGIKGGHPIAKHSTSKAVGLKRKLTKKTHNVKKGGTANTFRPFMM